MKHYAGIDLGTSNSAICSYDGTTTRIWKSPEQNEVTPSVLYFGPRGRRYVGKMAYDYAAFDEKNAAKLFKRAMGTSTTLAISSIDRALSPEECSSEILKTLFGYLPEEVRKGGLEGTIITVPAAFNQMQKDATLQAAKMANIGKVTLMQEPVAAIMSVMKAKPNDGVFLVFDLGGGTLDVSIAEALGGRVNLLALSGIQWCGGRDFDRQIAEGVVKPWIEGQFTLPSDWILDPAYRTFAGGVFWASEKAKIELSSREESRIILSETEARQKDRDGKEIWLDIPINRVSFDTLIRDQLRNSVEAAKEALTKAGLAARDIERIVFVGGPTQYKPLRDMICRELGVPGSGEVDPMTAVAVGAALFAESINWDEVTHTRKSSKESVTVAGPTNLAFEYVSRTPGMRSKLAVRAKGQVQVGLEFQVDSLESGWSSGRMPLVDGSVVEVPLAKAGENDFKIFIFDSSGAPVDIKPDRLTFVRTAATVDAIPASHSIGIEELDRIGGRSALHYLVRSGDPLPKAGSVVFRSAQELKAGEKDKLNFKIWEGDIVDPVKDNRLVGTLSIAGKDFNEGIIPAGAKLECHYEVADSGAISLEVSVPDIGASFGRGRNFYSRQEGQIDFNLASKRVKAEGKTALARLETVEKVVNDPRLAQVKKSLENVVDSRETGSDAEKSQEEMETVLAAKRSLAEVRKDHLKEIRTLELDAALGYFNEAVREHARPAEIVDFESLVKTARRSIELDDADFEHHVDALRQKNFDILWRQDWFVMARFQTYAQSPHLFADASRWEELTTMGIKAARADDFARLREVTDALFMMKIGGPSEEDLLQNANILRS